MLKLSCHCGQVTIETTKRPDYIHECNCTLCSKTGARWAYFHPSEVKTRGKTSSYARNDKEDPAAEVHFCPNCGSTTDFTLTESAVDRVGNGLMGVNMLLADEMDLVGVELRYPDGRAWPGEGDFAYLRPPRILGGWDTSG
jgi:hypothetical protein